VRRLPLLASAFDGRVRFEHDGCEAFAVREGGSFG
jgi:hypothetical protein